MTITPKLADTLAKILVKMRDPNQNVAQTAVAMFWTKLDAEHIDVRDLRFTVAVGRDKDHFDNLVGAYSRLEQALMRAQAELIELRRKERELADARKKIVEQNKMIAKLRADIEAMRPQPDAWVALIRKHLSTFRDWRISSDDLLKDACHIPAPEFFHYVRLRQVMAEHFPDWHSSTNVPAGSSRVRGYVQRQ